MTDSAQIHPLTYQPDSCPLFEALRDLPLPVLLDSAQPYSERGRYDIIAADPVDVLQASSKDFAGLSNSYDVKLKSFGALQRALARQLPLIQNPEGLPFCGGAIGFFSYELGNHLHKLDSPAASDGPLMHVGLYSWAIITDHHERRSYLVSHPATAPGVVKSVLERLATVPGTAAGEPFQLNEQITCNIDRQQYHSLFNRVQHYIRQGDCYQINLARRFRVGCTGDSWQGYKKLRSLAAAPFSAFLSTPERDIVCLSPERFLQVDGRDIRTEPIKGTAPRSPLPEQDQQLATELLNSDKNRAENLMIVDLLRNDLGQCCEPGSIGVDKLFELQSFNTVHHLVSTISGKLREGIHALDALAACFPGGSITGAPKKRAMEIISELEPDQRSVYCGSIAYISADGRMDSNIAIRTLVRANDELLCWSGGGIVADSEEQSEFDETWNKVGKLLKGL